jgi:hypothetical protein
MAPRPCYRARRLASAQVNSYGIFPIIASRADCARCLLLTCVGSSLDVSICLPRTRNKCTCTSQRGVKAAYESSPIWRMRNHLTLSNIHTSIPVIDLSEIINGLRFVGQVMRHILGVGARINGR